MPTTLRLRTLSVGDVGGTGSGTKLTLNNPRSTAALTSATAVSPSATRTGHLGRQCVVFTGDNTGATDVTAQIQAMIALAANHTNATYGKAGYEFLFPAGTYRISDTIRFQDWFSPVLAGMTEGLTAVTFSWHGPGDRPMVEFSSVTDGVIRNLTLKSAVPNLLTAVSIATRPGGFPISTNCRVERVTIEGQNRITNGVFIDSNANDNNNEFHQLVGCAITGCVYGFRVYGSQAHKWVLRDTSINLCTRGAFIERGIYGSIERCNIGYSTDWDIYLGTFAMQFRITELNSEGSKRFLFAAADNSHMGFIIEGVRWDGIGPDTDFGNVVQIESPGPVSFRDVKLSTYSGKRWYVRTGAFNQVGGLFSCGLVIRQQGCPSGDAVQTVATTDPNVRVLEVGSLVWDDSGVREGYIRPPADPSRLRLTGVAGPYNIVESQNPPSIANPFRAASGRRRSFAVAFKMTVNAPLSTAISSHPEFACVQGIGLWALSLGGGVYQFRAEGSGYNATWVGFAPDVEYLIALSYDRDTGRFLIRHGDVIASGGVNPATLAPVSTPVRLGTILTTPGPTDTRFNGTIRNIEFWDRALTSDEFASLT